MNHECPEHLKAELEDIEEEISAAQDRMSSLQLRIALWHCSQGRHVIGLFQKPPIGRACIYCRTPAVEQDAAPESV